MDNLDDIIKELSAEQKKDVATYVQGLVENQTQRPRVYLKQDWAGTLREFREKYDGVSLQKTALLSEEG